MDGHHLHLQQQQQQLQYGINIPQQIQGMESATIGPVSDRFPQWSVQETRDFLMIRAELDQAFLETKRNKLLWEVVATKMKEKGYNRSSEQCKCKWKNLVTRYKGCETMEPEGMRQQFQFYGELQAIFTARMHRMLWMEAEAGGSGKKKAPATLSSSSEEEEPNEDSEGEKLLAAANVNAPKRRRKAAKVGGSGGGASGSGGGASGLKEVLEEFMKQQVQVEMEWMKAYEAREEERQKREMEWRAKMEALEKERMMLERMWREREEQRRSREEARAERRDALITALLEKLRRGG